MKPEEFPIGSKVAWTMRDNCTMAGSVVRHLYSGLEVKRVDGSIVHLQFSNTSLNIRFATPVEQLAACDWFATLGK